ncbi:MAG: type II toxin-antitoxin system VapC family toxin [Verrucomicrobiales bacterium]|nr:type II toxin-antitoxin system VapC family toxin [Verrucomicrobiales bacterium]
MTFYADTGFLLSLHLHETTSAAAARVMEKVEEPLPLTWLVSLEFRNALWLGRFRNWLTEQERAAAAGSFKHDLEEGRLLPAVLDIEVVTREAERLADLFTATVGVRALDLLHVASALVLRCTEFLSFDKRQRAMAARAGMMVQPEAKAAVG